MGDDPRRQPVFGVNPDVGMRNRCELGERQAYPATAKVQGAAAVISML